jgi:hypothetical protein
MLNVGVHLRIAYFHTYALLNLLYMYCPQTRHHGDASNAKFIKFCFCPQISHGVSQNISSKDSSALRLWQNRFAKHVSRPVFRPKARSQVVVNEQWTLPMGDLIACFFLLPLAYCNVRWLKMSYTFGRCQGWNKKQRYGNRNGMDVAAIGEATSIYSEGNLIPCTDTVVVAKCIDSWIMDLPGSRRNRARLV